MRECILLIEDMRLAVTTPRPGNNLILISLEHDDGRVSERGTTDSGVWVISQSMEVTEHNVIFNHIRQSVGVLSDAAWCIGD